MTRSITKKNGRGEATAVKEGQKQTPNKRETTSGAVFPKKKPITTNAGQRIGVGQTRSAGWSQAETARTPPVKGHLVRWPGR